MKLSSTFACDATEYGTPSSSLTGGIAATDGEDMDGEQIIHDPGLVISMRPRHCEACFCRARRSADLSVRNPRMKRPCHHRKDRPTSEASLCQSILCTSVFADGPFFDIIFVTRPYSQRTGSYGHVGNQDVNLNASLVETRAFVCDDADMHVLWLN